MSADELRREWTTISAPCLIGFTSTGWKRVVDDERHARLVGDLRDGFDVERIEFRLPTVSA